MLLVTSAFAACSDKLDINTNPVQPVTTSSNLRLPGVLGNMAYHLYSHARFSVYHSYYFTNRLGSTRAIEDTWNYNSITRMGAWRWHYYDVGSNVNGLIERAIEEGSTNYLGVAKIMLAFSYLTATDSFGDMPFTEAYSGSYYPKYDTQETIYAGIANLLDEGVAALDQESNKSLVMNSASDLVYAGDLQKWKAFAFAVKSRMLLHTANFTNNYDAVISNVNIALSNFDDAMIKYPESSSDLWEKNLWGETAAQPEWQFADIKNISANSLPTDFLMNALTIDAVAGKYDPRLYALTTPGENKKYLGAKESEGLSDLNLPTGTTYKDFATLTGGFWTADKSPYPFILKEELYFIKAEAEFYKGNATAAFEAWKQGVKINFSRLGIADGESLNYLSSSKVPQDAGELKISDIMMQKWLALYLQSETWVDMRRYNYSATAYPGVYYPKNALKEWGGRNIQRFPYDPQTEYVYNPQEIARLGATARDWCFNPVWWAEKSTLK
ncbi:SusD-like starch-binding protein associating with outer membrane [Sphingobacterium siyangense]|uniref:SusD-like starch-binding protein associating with outer membrane n=2 Tax=Sphingobacterium siyangense TaxID=459529 RepID=A0A562MCA4_9SPHI|nr:SusD-like starch-binding protein associating with outer membrane [Sphingobacterium siyangense]